MQAPFVAIPIRSFRDAKQRLADILDQESRAELARALATHTADTVTRSGAVPVVVSSSPDVASWASLRRYQRLLEPRGGGLDGAATAALAAAGDRSWLVLHSDLPCLTAAELRRAYDALTMGSFVAAPSYDGGTTAVGGVGEFPFSYGPGSFHRHIGAAPNSHVIASLGFLLDIDAPTDLEAARSHPRGRWLAEYLPSSTDGM